MDTKIALGILPIILSAINLVYYLYHVYFGRTRPHLFSWLIWALVAGIAAAGQYAAGAGAGSWITIAIAIFCVIRVIAAFTHGEKTITRSDWICLAVCLLAILFWVITHDPLWSVALVSFIDVGALYPTARKSWAKPFEENAFSYFLFGLTSFLGLLATENYNVTTVLYPAAVISACWTFTIFLLWRRKVLK